MLSGDLAVLQAPIFDGLPFDPFALFDDGGSPAEVGVGGRHIVQALVVTLVVVMLDEGLDLGLEVAGQEVVFQQDAVFQGLVPALDLALGLGVERSTAHMTHFLGLDVFSQFAGDVAGAVIAEQPGLVQHRGAVAAEGHRECCPSPFTRTANSSPSMAQFLPLMLISHHSFVLIRDKSEFAL